MVARRLSSFQLLEYPKMIQKHAVSACFLEIYIFLRRFKKNPRWPIVFYCPLGNLKTLERFITLSQDNIFSMFTFA